MTKLSRRGFVVGAAAVLVGPRSAPAQSGEPIVLRAMRARAQLLEPGEAQTDVWSLGSVWPPPVLRAKQGQVFTARIANALDRPITLHWHGVRGPAEVMTVRVEPGDENAVDCRFTPPDAGTFWLGPVEDVSRQREMGLYAMLVVEEAELAPDIADQPLILDDWRLTNQGAIEESFGDLEQAIAEGRLGNWFTVNGVYRPKIEAPRGKLLRLRALNAANVRTMGMEFKGIEPKIIALDGQPVTPRPIGDASFMLAPGQRVDFLVEAGAAEATLALDLFEDVVEVAYFKEAGSGHGVKMPESFRLPTNPIALDLDSEAARHVSLVLEGGAKGGLKSAIYKGEKLELRALLEKRMVWAMSGTAGLGSDPWQIFKRDEDIVIDIENRTTFDQPLHIQGHVWRQIKHAGKPVEEDVWRDTAVIPARGNAKLAFRADNPGEWRLHSTIAERIDTGMITAFRVG